VCDARILEPDPTDVLPVQSADPELVRGEEPLGRDIFDQLKGVGYPPVALLEASSRNWQHDQERRARRIDTTTRRCDAGTAARQRHAAVGTGRKRSSASRADALRCGQSTRSRLSRSSCPRSPVVAGGSGPDRRAPAPTAQRRSEPCRRHSAGFASFRMGRFPARSGPHARPVRSVLRQARRSRDCTARTRRHLRILRRGRS
jgi:hypothetical protein